MRVGRRGEAREGQEGGSQVKKLAIAGLAVLCGCGGKAAIRVESKPPAGGEALASYREEIRAYREKRVARLTSDTGWLTVAGLFWLHPGENKFGTDPKNDIVLPEGSGPAFAGVFVHEDSITRVRPSTDSAGHVDGQ